MTAKVTYHNTPAALAAGVLLLVLITVARASAQDAMMQNDFEHKVNLYNVNGKLMTNAPVEATGTPYFIDQWKNGSIQLFTGQVYDHLPLKIDLEHQQVHFRKPDKNEYLIDAGAVKRVILNDSSGKTPVTDTFECGFPAIDNQKEQNFYRVLSNGKITFLQSLRKLLREDKDDVSGDIRKEYRFYDDYYFFREGKMERIKKDRSYILNSMNDKENRIEDFLQKNKISFKSVSDIRKLLVYYNNLP